MDTLLTVRELRKTYRRGGGVFSQDSNGARFTAVDGVSFSVSRGETFAVVGESGCGKTTLARMLLRLIEPDGGELQFEGRAARCKWSFKILSLRSIPACASAKSFPNL
jgi:ABC-type oligopeptide transport system ATPase subunit